MEERGRVDFDGATLRLKGYGCCGQAFTPGGPCSAYPYDTGEVY
jgi:hypothetical protein